MTARMLVLDILPALSAAALHVVDPEPDAYTVG